MNDTDFLFSQKQHEIISQLSLMVMSSKSVIQIQNLILDKLVDNMDSPYVVIARRIDDTNQLMLYTKRTDILSQKVVDVESDMSPHSPEQKAMESGSAISIKDFDQSQFEIPSFLTKKIRSEIKSGVSIVLKTDKKSIGFVSVYDRHRDAFKLYDVDFLKTVAQLVSVAVDRLETETQLMRYKERLELAQTSNGTGVFEWNLVSDMIWWSRGEEKLFKVPDGTFDDQYLARDSFSYWRERVHPDDRKQVSKAIRKALESKDTDYQNEFRIIYPGGMVRWIKSVARIYYDSNLQPARLLGVNYDITEQQRQEERKDAFISMASHELKTPLTSIKAFNQMIMRKLNSGSIPEQELEIYLEKIGSQIDKLTLLINELLDVTRIKQGKLYYSFEKFDLIVMLEEILETIGQSYPSHRIVLTAPSNLLIEGDPNRLEQTIINLLTNAIKYSPRSNRVDIKVEQPSDQDVTIAVTDYGIGIPVSHQEKIGERFYRVEGRDEEKYPGMGIGLYISYQIIDEHRGKIWFESTEGEGTTFYITLPVNQPKS